MTKLTIRMDARNDPSEQNCELLAKFRQVLANERRIRQKCAKKTQKIREIAKFEKLC